jgi:predicted flap endonuclease-1-like 5' DNA nuclease
MIALFVQTLLLMMAAYFVGAAVACIVRRSFSAATRPQPSLAHPVEPLPEMVRPAAGPDRFGRGGEAEARPPPRPAPPSPPLVVPPDRLAVPMSESEAQDLKRIRRIDGELEARLNKLGVRRYDAIAAWMQPQVRRISEALGLGDRISKENWIEQAQVLARGGVTYYATRAARGEVANAAPTPDEGEPTTLAPAADATTPAAFAPRASTGGAAAVAALVTVAPTAPTLPPTQPSAPSASPHVSERAAFAVRSAQELAPAAPTAPAVPIRPAAPAARDNLQRISGIDAEIEKLLLAQGISRYSQIALWSPVDVARTDALLGASGRIGRENWIEQAQILSRGGDTAFSRDYDRRARGEASAAAARPAKLADAIRETAAKAAAATAAAPRADLAALRSVRSEAYQGAGQPQAGSRIGVGKALRPQPAEDLKRIRGIGVLIEKKLNQMGIVAYEQIANWTAEEMDRVSQSLDFKGRIERENWVEQARILASGGTTEFSRRVDRGEVETSRYRP